MLVAVWQASPTCKLVTATRMLLLERRLRSWKRAARSCRQSTNGCTTASAWNSSCWLKVLQTICLLNTHTMCPARAAGSRQETLMTASMFSQSLTPTSSLWPSVLRWRRHNCNWLRAHRRCTTCMRPTAACMKPLVCVISTPF